MADFDIFTQTRTRERFSLLNPDPAAVDLEDIIWGLSHIMRFNGLAGMYSVAQHSYIVCRNVPDGSPNRVRIWALLHDAHKAYMGDIIHPVARFIDHVDYEREGVYHNGIDILKKQLDEAIRERFGLEDLTEEEEELIHLLDRRALATERRDLLPPSSVVWPGLECIEPFPEKIEKVGAMTAMMEFQAICHQLDFLRRPDQ